MKNIIDQIKLLYEQELYTNVARVCSLAITIYDQRSDPLTAQNKCQISVYYADSLYYLEKYSQAENTYIQALQLKKNIVKNKNATKLSDHLKDITSDLEIKYKIHLCYIKLKQVQKALSVLQSIPARSRIVKINMALGHLYRNSGMERSAITCYKEVLRESPLALEAAESLLALGVNGSEVNSLMLDGTSTPNTATWLNQWLRGQAEMQSRDYKTAIMTFTALDNSNLLKDNVTLLVTLGQCYHYHGDNKKAVCALHRAINLDPYSPTGLDVLASLLSKEDKIDELERLIPVDLDLNRYSSEHWVAMAYYMYSTKKYSKAAYFAQKACDLSPRNVEALILKGSILLDLKKYPDAAVHLREAMQISPFRFEAHEYLALCYINMNRVRDAVTVATNACKQLGQSPRALTLYASVMLRDPISVPKAKSLLERIVRMEQGSSEAFIRAVFLLVDCYEQEMSLEAAVSLLTKNAELIPTSRLHQMLGHCYSRMSNDEKAFEHYNIALNLNPKNRRALEALHALGRAGDGPGNSAPLSDHEHDAESDSEAWPHIELRHNSFP